MPVGRAPEIPGLSQPHTYKSPSLHHINAFHIYKAQKYVFCILVVSLVAVNMHIPEAKVYVELGVSLLDASLPAPSC